jgi:hypothetical protein
LETSDNLILTDSGYIPEYRIVIEYTDLDGTEVSESEMIYPTVTETDIIDGGTAYGVGNIVNVVDDFSFRRRFTSDGVTTLLNSGISGTLLSAETQVIIDPDGAASLLTEGVDYTLSQSSVQLLAPVGENTIIDVNLFSKGSVLTVNQADGSGAIVKVTVFNGGVGYSGNTVDLSASGNGDAVLELNEDVITLEYEGRYINNDGHLSSTPVLQDGFKNQGFSYVIKSSRSIDQYGEILKRLLHPAGFIYFGEVSLIDCISLLIRSACYEYDFPDKFSYSDTTTDSLAPRLGPRYRSFDENKLRYKIWDGIEPNTPALVLYNELFDYFINTPDDRLKYLIDGYIGITATLDLGFVSNADLILSLNYDINEGDSITVEGTVSGTIIPNFIDYEENVIGIDADAGGENITVEIIINTTE